MKKLFIVLFLSISTSIFSQGNFTTEWESPAGWRFKGVYKLDLNLNVKHLIFYETANSNNIRIYNSLTHNVDYSWSANIEAINGITGTFYGGSYTDYWSDHFDVTGDGINELIEGSISNGFSVFNPVNGLALYSGEFLDVGDFDGDGYVEIIDFEYNTEQIKIISTPAQTVSVNNQNEIVKNYELKQNYPNPFNPTTTIEYSLNKNSDVKIIIYDILGKEINTLVNQKQVSGTYKLNLNASAFSSGTYFYSLILDGVTESKKMVLIK